MKLSPFQLVTLEPELPGRTQRGLGQGCSPSHVDILTLVLT